MISHNAYIFSWTSGRDRCPFSIVKNFDSYWFLAVIIVNALSKGSENSHFDHVSPILRLSAIFEQEVNNGCYTLVLMGLWLHGLKYIETVIVYQSSYKLRKMAEKKKKNQMFFYWFSECGNYFSKLIYRFRQFVFKRKVLEWPSRDRQNL